MTNAQQNSKIENPKKYDLVERTTKFSKDICKVPIFSDTHSTSNFDLS